MPNEEIAHTIEEQHTAMGSISGYVFQYYVFLHKLLTMQKDEEVSFELYDDVASKSQKATTLFQVKHTIKVAIDDNAMVLSNRATDMWKAIEVWRKFITAEAKDGTQRTGKEQLQYINDHEFVLYINKKFENNKIFLLCNKIRNHKNENANAEIDTILDSITKEGKQRKGGRCAKENTQTYIDRLKSYKLKNEFLSKVRFENCTFNSIDQECIRVLKEDLFLTNPGQAESAFYEFKKEVDIDLKKSAKKGVPLKYTYTDRHRRFGQVFSNARATALDFQLEMQEYKREFLDLVCIKQLIKVGDLKRTNIDLIAKRTSHFLSFKNRYEELKESYQITNKESNDFIDDAVCFWENEFNYTYGDTDSSTTEAELKRKARKLLNKVRSHNVTLRNQLSIPISNGAYYYLSDECLIGWHLEWRRFFKKNK